MSHNKTYTQLAGSKKGGRPIVNKTNYNISSQKQSSVSIWKYLLIVLVIASVILGLIWMHINGLIIWFERPAITEETLLAMDLNLVEDEFQHYFWTFLNALMMGVYISALIPLSGKRNLWLSVILIIAVIVMAILSLGYLGFFLYLNFDFLPVKTYISNQTDGTLFFIGNMVFFLLLYAMSFIIESEVD